MFAAWGRFVFRRKWWVLATSILLLAGVAGVGFTLKGQLNNTSHVHFESQRAIDLINAQFPKTAGSGSGGGSSFELLFTSSSLQVNDPAYKAAVEQTLERAKGSGVAFGDPVALGQVLDEDLRHGRSAPRRP